MKIYDDVKVIRDREEYKAEGVFKGMEGYIVMPEIRDNSFLVCFIDEVFKKENNPEWFAEHLGEIKDDIFCIIKIEDLELVKDNGSTDKEILRELPKNNSCWWCKVEDGFILNLNGKKKNKIPYDYNS